MKRFGILFLLIPACMALIVVSAGSQEAEPAYNGKTLTEWLTLYRRTSIQYAALNMRVDGKPVVAEDSPQVAEHVQAKEAVRKIGTNALPILLKWIGQEPKKQNEEDQSFAAAAGFSILGAEAKAAIPDLTLLMMNTNKPFASICAIGTMGTLGLDALPPLLTVISNSQLSSAYREAAVGSIFRVVYIGTNTPPVTPDLSGCLREGGPVTELAMKILLESHVQPQVTIPTVAALLDSTNAHIRQCAAEWLAIAGPQARPAVPALLEALEDPQIFVRAAATNTLRKVAPETLEH